MPTKAPLFFGADAGGWHLKTKLRTYLTDLGYRVIDLSRPSPGPDDSYPSVAARVASGILEPKPQATRAILVSASAHGMAIAANRLAGIRAVVLVDKNQAFVCRNDQDSNLLIVPAEVFGTKLEDLFDLSLTWLQTPFEDLPRRRRHLKKLDDFALYHRP